MILTPKYLETYKSENGKGRTERIILQQCATIKSVDEDLKIPLTFRLDSKTTSFYFKAEDQSSKEMWIGAIGKLMIKPGVLRSLSEEEALNGQRQFIVNYEIFSLFGRDYKLFDMRLDQEKI